MGTRTRADKLDAEFRILALAGGGFLGLYTATVLAALEERVGEPLGRRFDMIAGTSVGGVLAIALAFEIPMMRVVRLFRENGTRIFSTRSLPRGALTQLLDLARTVTGPKYDGRALRQALERWLGTRTLADAIHPFVIPAANVTRCETKVFKTPHAPGSTGDETLRVVDVAMAACAAPAYFPSVRIGDALYADGGLFAVAPDLVALHEAEHFMGIAPTEVRMLSVGTATSGYRPAAGVSDDAGAVGWLAEGRLLLTLIALHQQHIAAMMEDRLAQRYLRLDASWPVEEGLGIDVATAAAATRLVRLGEATMRAVDSAKITQFVGAPRA
ncbi:MAG: CBASS cGAMP-activated phospholipase [Burkholderiales bacterium]